MDDRNLLEVRRHLFQTRCPVVVDRCRSEEPRLPRLADGRWTACHLTESGLG